MASEKHLTIMDGCRFGVGFSLGVVFVSILPLVFILFFGIGKYLGDLL